MVVCLTVPQAWHFGDHSNDRSTVSLLNLAENYKMHDTSENVEVGFGICHHNMHAPYRFANTLINQTKTKYWLDRVLTPGHHTPLNPLILLKCALKVHSEDHQTLIVRILNHWINAYSTSSAPRPSEAFFACCKWRQKGSINHYQALSSVPWWSHRLKWSAEISWLLPLAS